MKKHDRVILKNRVFEIIQIGNRNDIVSRGFDILIVAAILLNITVTFLDTFDSMEPYRGIIRTVETVTLLLFMAEYILRIWTADRLYPQYSRPKAVLKFLVSYDGIVDLLTILPFFMLQGFVAFRMLRVVRIFHLFRINANYDSFNVIRSVLLEKKNQIASSLFILVILILASSLCMYSAEHDAQPEVFRNALSGIWWSVSALLTVGYGDIYPITFAGKAMAIVISILGVMVVAIPTGIISAGFVENYTEAQNSGISTMHDDVIQIQIDDDSAWTGKSSAELKAIGYTALLCERNGVLFPPEEDYKAQIGDTLTVFRKINENDQSVN